MVCSTRTDAAGEFTAPTVRCPGATDQPNPHRIVRVSGSRRCGEKGPQGARTVDPDAAPAPSRTGCVVDGSRIGSSVTEGHRPARTSDTLSSTNTNPLSICNLHITPSMARHEIREERHDERE
jgi:hypothetical protein